MVRYLPEHDGSGQLGLSEDDCSELVDLNWQEWAQHKLSFWHPDTYQTKEDEITKGAYVNGVWYADAIAAHEQERYNRECAEELEDATRTLRKEYETLK